MTGAEGAPLILVVDDQNSNLQVIGEVLDRAGYRVMPARSGEQAIARASLRRPDLVLLDMRMPDMDGIEMLEALHSTPEWRSLPVGERITHALVQGIDEFAETDTEELRLEIAARGGKPIEQVLQDFGLIDIDTQLQVMADHLGTEVIDLKSTEITPCVAAS